jgi:holo-[acyl-carrier protein] synthase
MADVSLALYLACMEHFGLYFTMGGIMILGIGMDIVETDRIERAALRLGERFWSRICTPSEKMYCFGKASPWNSLAARFAAKEAAFKALGRGWPDCGGYVSVEVCMGEHGRPGLIFHGKAQVIADDLGVRNVLVSLTHDGGYAAASVVLEG